ncbi:nuclear valosin-containing protein-like [Paramacrobiotus metropolitanus]|uniref:nuclear valosin-containing protein-like n=1 Tax=Paramacrobiotus metropolitanus TaxID=2943436 RepID=UPI002446241E|nr:nuclear valosin-containing protein-like [Paramacrobiotus metropolitanus]
MNSSPSTGKLGCSELSPSHQRRDMAPLAKVPGHTVRPSGTNSDQPKISKHLRKEDPMVVRPTTRLSDVGGQDHTIEEICRLLLHLRHPEIFQTLGVAAPRGILLHGPPGSGKSLLAHAIAGELQIPMLKIAAPEMVSGISGESEERLRELFKKAEVYAPCILFIDEIDAITQKREGASKDMEKRIVAQLLFCLDELSSRPTSQIFLVGATNAPDTLDPALRRAGRFDREVSLGIPNEKSRLQILELVTKSLKLSTDVDLKEMAHQTPGFVGADLKSLVSEAAMEAVNRVFGQLSDLNQSSGDKRPQDSGTMNMDIDPVAESPVTARHMLSTSISGSTAFPLEWLKDLSIKMKHFTGALKRVQPSAKREGFATIPNVCWDDVGALTDIREELELAIVAPVRYPAAYEKLGIQNPSGILLCGPPGCGKTLLAKAVANESGLNFISVKGPELLNMYVGESERAVRQVFLRAKNSAPCVIFFDEIDALCPRRTDSGDSNATARVVNQLLTELDGLEQRKLVFVIGATNRPDILDPAMLRPGRLDKLLFVDLPDQTARTDILRTITKNGKTPPMDADVNFDEVALLTDRFSGADLASLVREAASLLIREQLKLLRAGNCGAKFSVECLSDLMVKKNHIEDALKKIKPSVTTEVYHSYLALKERLRQN